ncbi:protein GDAP2 homolog isoform X1 [Hydra vulgaris]|uniref:protein GDAP2 homolog isoform X1 n=1 Tax=Hydra vulgaris TaxID=6087 RepID=UPI000640CC08|nr:protein GDAP2 homolog [Hydra vulgaris]XP_047128492.1 protein GDAP2 homolog [Hydra vulgaris]
MDPLGLLSGIIDAETLPRWSQTNLSKCPEVLEERESPFPVNIDINDKICLWEGDITKLNCDIIVNSTNESLNDKNPISERIFKVAGPLLQQEIMIEVQNCRTGEAKMSKGYGLPSRYVVHTVGPRYNTKYKTAAESALYMCYRNVLQLAYENNLHSIGLTVINSTRRGYPPEEGAHIALRTVRRYLEHNIDAFGVIVFVVEPIDESTYKRLMPMYFPRDKKEEQFAIGFLPSDIGNEDGEPFLPERQIRIMDKPLKANNGIDLLNSFVGRHPFAKVAADLDTGRRAKLQGRSQVEQDILEQQRKYSQWIKRSRTEDFSEISKLGFLSNPGVDLQGRPVVVFIGRFFPAHVIDLNKAVSYFIHFMDTIASREYVFLYFHTLTTEDHQLDMTFLKHFYEMLDIKYRRNMHSFQIIHGSVWLRVCTWFFTIFNAATIKDKINFVPGVQYLYDIISPDQLEIPPFIMEFDIQENGPSYYTPKTKHMLVSPPP